MQNRCRKKVRIKRKKCLKRSVNTKEVSKARKCQRQGSVERKKVLKKGSVAQEASVKLKIKEVLKERKC